MNQRISTDGSSLAALLDATARGERAAFRALYETTAPKLFGVVLRITRSRPTAEEVLQETFIKIWQNAERFAPEMGQPMAWLTSIARNRAIDRIRSEKNRAQSRLRRRGYPGQAGRAVDGRPGDAAGPCHLPRQA